MKEILEFKKRHSFDLKKNSSNPLHEKTENFNFETGRRQRYFKMKFFNNEKINNSINT